MPHRQTDGAAFQNKMKELEDYFQILKQVIGAQIAAAKKS